MATIREQVHTAIEAEIIVAARNDHEMNYHRLDVHRDGELVWRESVSWERTIDDEDESPNCVPLPTLTTVGRGSIACNCEWCSPPCSCDRTACEECMAGEDCDCGCDCPTHTAHGADDVEFDGDELQPIEEGLLAALTEVPIGYFDDEGDED